MHWEETDMALPRWIIHVAVLSALAALAAVIVLDLI
jgi:hypothetical protein